jgi:peptidoglycan hydrolase-like protein with peptidoglycan-binding domain
LPASGAVRESWEDEASVDDGDFEFEFFPEHGTPAGDEREEALWEEEGSDLRGDRAPGPGPPPPEIAMRRRIAAAAVIALLLLIILIVVLTQGSGGGGGPYRSYLAGLTPVATDSEQVGASLTGALGGKQTASSRNGLVAKLDSLVQQTVDDVARLQALTPPPTLRAEHAQALAALDLRLRGLQGIRDSLAQALVSADSTPWAAVLSGQMDDLVTSDVIWDSLVRTPGDAVLQANGLGGSSVPESRFVTDSKSLLTSIQSVLQTQTVAANAPVLSLGAKGTDVTAWQTQLNAWLKLTAPTQTPLTADGTFGASTQTATEALQTSAGLAPDGVVGPSTRQALQRALAGTKPSSTPGSTTTAAVLKLGDKSSAVTAWQTQLNAWLKLTAPTQTPLTADGTFGAATQTTTEALQTTAGLAPDGIVGPSTRQALSAALAAGKGPTGATG